MAIKTTVNPDGSATVEITNDLPVLNRQGVPTEEKQTSRWETRDLEHTKKHVATWSDPARPATERLTQGEKSAMLDQLNEISKQLES